MFSSLFSISFASAGALLLAGLIPLLILAYLKRKPQRRKTVSSIIILRLLQKRRTIKRRFKPPLRFFLELLALLLLVLAAAIPSLDHSGLRVAVVLDNTLSMRAKEDGPSSPDRLTKAKEAISSWVEKQSSGSRYSLYVSSPRLLLTGEEETSASSLLSSLKDLKASLSSDTLSASATELAESQKYDTILLVSDREVDYTASPDENTEDTASNRTKIVSLRVGKAVPNVYVRNVKVLESPMRRRYEAVLASIGLSGSKPVDVTLKLYGAEALDTSASMSSEPIETRQLELHPERANQVRFDLSEARDKLSLFRVELTPESSSQSNAILEDDIAWVSQDASASAALLVVSPDPPNENAFGLTEVPAFAVTHISPQKFASLSASELSRYAVLLFHKSAPSIPPSVPTLLVFPPSQNLLFPTAHEVENPQITSWATTHPIASYLRMRLIKPQASLLFDVPLWAQSIINTEEGSLLLAGESRGVRFAAIGIDLLPFEGAKNRTQSILTLNLLSWLSGGQELASGLLTGSPLRLEAGFHWTIQDPQHNLHTIDATKGSAQFFTLHRPGPYKLSDEKRSREQTLCVNVFYPEESATASIRPYPIARSFENTRSLSSDEEAIWPQLLTLALALVLLEFLLHFFMKTENLAPEAP